MTTADLAALEAGRDVLIKLAPRVKPPRHRCAIQRAIARITRAALRVAMKMKGKPNGTKTQGKPERAALSDNGVAVAHD